MSEKLGCAKCGTALQQPKTGRPRLFCGEICRQAAAYEVRRVQRLLSSLEADASHYRTLPDDEYTRYVYGTRWKDRLKATNSRIAAAEARLRLLLGKTRGTPLGVARGT
ncbi:MAG: hypothetical protein Q7T33_04540 [Dehalococcoidia bacterium]|nr:hypothetical protein [Dehalococcoidia bacterium]